MTSSPTPGPIPARPSLPESFTGDAHEPDREALASLAAGRADRRSDADWVADAARVAAAADLDATREFWGEAPNWRRSGEIERTPRRSPARRSSSANGGGPSRRRRAPLRRATGTSVAGAGTRSHRVVEPDDAADRRDRTPGPPPSPDRPPPSPSTASSSGFGGVDPLLFRLGVIVMIGVLLVPVLLGVRSGSNDRNAGLRTLAAGEMADVLPLRPTGRAVPVSAATEIADVGVVGTETDEATGTTEVADGAPAQPVTAASCDLEYTVVAGDYWLRLADASDVELSALLQANSATVDTPLYPGDEICLPDGATHPAPPPPPTTAAPVSTVEPRSADVASSTSSSGSTAAPTTAAAPSTSPPATTSPATSPPATTSPATSSPATTAPSTTAPVAPPAASNPSPQQVRQIIREVFPEDQHEMAITVAGRESSFRANAYNGLCCHGIFQIHWQAHRSWLQGQGITSSADLYDARTNIELAYKIYQRSGGWGPWSQTAY